MHLNLAKNKPSGHTKARLPPIKRSASKPKKSLPKNKASPTRLPPLNGDENDADNLSRQIFESSVSYFGEKLQQLRSETSCVTTSLTFDSIKNKLRKETMGIYREKYCHGQTSLDNAKRIISDVGTFKDKSWLQQIQLANNIVRVNVLKRISNYETRATTDAQSMIGQFKNNSKIFSNE